MTAKTADSDIRRVQNEKELEKRDSGSDECTAGGWYGRMRTDDYSQ